MFMWNPLADTNDFVRQLVYTHCEQLDTQVYIFNSNIYYQPSPGAASIAVTQNGNAFVSNGIADWLYEGGSTR
jgi:hypothetical protein